MSKHKYKDTINFQELKFIKTNYGFVKFLMEKKKIKLRPHVSNYGNFYVFYITCTSHMPKTCTNVELIPQHTCAFI